jgi:hypothetical protein
MRLRVQFYQRAAVEHEFQQGIVFGFVTRAPLNPVRFGQSGDSFNPFLQTLIAGH